LALYIHFAQTRAVSQLPVFGQPLRGTANPRKRVSVTIATEPALEKSKKRGFLFFYA
jgi:hypothetical protein